MNFDIFLPVQRGIKMMQAVRKMFPLNSDCD